MPVYHGRASIGTAATVIPFTSHMPWTIDIHNDDNADNLWIGGSAVGTATGLQVNKLEHFTFNLSALDRVYAVSSKAGHQVSWLATTRG